MLGKILSARVSTDPEVIWIRSVTRQAAWTVGQRIGKRCSLLMIRMDGPPSGEEAMSINRKLCTIMEADMRTEI